MSLWSSEPGHNRAVSTWCLGKKKACGHKTFREGKQTKEDLLFFARAQEHFSKQGQTVPVILDSQIDVFREAVFWRPDKSNIASSYACTAYEIAVREIPLIRKKTTVQVFYDNDSEAEDGTVLCADGQPYADMESGGQTKTFDLESETEIIEMCTRLDKCYVMFAGNHAGLPRENNGCLNPALYCPFGKFGIVWRDEQIESKIDTYEKYASCDTKFSTFSLLMEHLKGTECPCHEAAYAFMEIMYSNDDDYNWYKDRVNQKNYTLVTNYKNPPRWKHDNDVDPKTEPVASSTVTHKYKAESRAGNVDREAVVPPSAPAKCKEEKRKFEDLDYRAVKKTLDMEKITREQFK